MSYQLPFKPRRENPWEAANLRQAARRAKKASHAKDAWKLRQAAAAAAGRPLKKTLTTSKTLLYKQLDHLCKLIVFRRDMKRFSGYCLVCVIKRELGFKTKPPNPIDTPYHIKSRANKATRWDLRNIIGACHGCNLDEKESRGNELREARLRAVHSVIIGEDVLCEVERLARTTATDLNLIALRDERKAQLEGRA